MRRNLIIIVCIFLAILALMVFGNVIVVGEKVASVTHLWWMEWLFYGILLAVFAYYVLHPIWRIHRTPAFPVLAVNEEASEAQLKEYGKRLANHCDFIEGKQQRSNHQKNLKEKLLHASGSRPQLLKVVKDELAFRYDGDKDKGILGINGQIKEWAKTVFVVTALSQNSKVDAISTLVLDFTMMKNLITSTGFRPNNLQMWRLYIRILITSLFAYAVSEAFIGAGSIKPFGSLDDIDVSDAGDVVAADVDIDADSDSFSLTGILSNIKIPGLIVGSVADGISNALLTLRIGYVTRSYLIEGQDLFFNRKRRKEVRKEALTNSMKALPSVLKEGCKGMGKGMQKLIERTGKWYTKDEVKIVTE